MDALGSPLADALEKIGALASELPTSDFNRVVTSSIKMQIQKHNCLLLPRTPHDRLHAGDK